MTRQIPPIDNLTDASQPIPPESSENDKRAVLVHINFHTQHTEEYLTEFKELAVASGLAAAAFVTGSRVAPDAKYFVGSGKAEEIKQMVQATQAKWLLVNHSLSPVQERNLERLCQCRVLDRTGLILEIFAQRARTFEGKLQVELAQLQHASTRLVRGWTHLERQRGGIGLRGGPGETQIEVDRRLIRNRINSIKLRLEKVRQQRDLSRRARRRVPIPTISLVGYTNAGKSTLFNRLTHAEVFAANQLFATLDPTLRRVDWPELGGLIFADTVGFIRDLPHDLVDAFKATLEETLEATLLLHVVDANNLDRQLYIEQVNQVITEIGATAVPQLQVYNKIDLLPEQTPRIDYDANGAPVRVWLSAVTGHGIDLLQQAIITLLNHDVVEDEIRLLPTQAKMRAELYELNSVVNERVDENGSWHISIRLSRLNYEKWLHKNQHSLENKQA